MVEYIPSIKHTHVFYKEHINHLNIKINVIFET